VQDGAFPHQNPNNRVKRYSQVHFLHCECRANRVQILRNSARQFSNQPPENHSRSADSKNYNALFENQLHT
jgi:hypothetical protein